MLAEEPKSQQGRTKNALLKPLKEGHGSACQQHMAMDENLNDAICVWTDGCLLVCKLGVMTTSSFPPPVQHH